MGLLLGDILPEEEAFALLSNNFMKSCVAVPVNANKKQKTTKTDKNKSEEKRFVSLVWAVSIHVRSDRRKDRVEISPEQQSASAEEAERLSARIGRQTRVVGWYHSHPHLTVFPSHVDVRTQWSYQTMERHFIGLIFGCFEKNHLAKASLASIAEKDKAAHQAVGRLQLIAFQSVDCEGKNTRASTESKELATHTGVRYQRLEVPICVLPLKQLHPLWSEKKDAHSVLLQASLQNLLQLTTTFVKEERRSFYDLTYGTPPPTIPNIPCSNTPPAPPTAGSPSKGEPLYLSVSPPCQVHPLATVHNGAIYFSTVCKLLEHMCFPLVQSLHSKINEHTASLAHLRYQNQLLRKKLEESDPT